jgi:exopolysaccharide biosynthesis polyprenyl glycosylphosphotransferase
VATDVPTIALGVRVPPLPRQSKGTWERRYLRVAVAADALAATIAAAVGFLAAVTRDASAVEAYAVEALVMPFVWLLAIGISGGYERRFLGAGSEEYRRVALGALGVIAFVGVVSWATQADIARSFVVFALPTAALLTWAGRWALQKRAVRLRRRGEFTHRTLLVGQDGAVDRLAERLVHSGYQVLGACVPTDSLGDAPQTVPLVGTFDTVVQAVHACDADTVAVVAGPGMHGESLRQLSWDLEQTGANLLVAPGLIEVAGPRLAVRPVEGLPLLHVEHPRFSGLKRLIKTVYDPLVAAVALVLLSPVLLAIAVAIKLDSPGPVLFRQARVGHLGRPFMVNKFRTMVADADQRKHEVAALNEGSGPLFKAREDPRITRVGAFLRRTSLDELPQLFNVLIGNMSLVGPRPHLPSEVAQFGEDMCRRLFVKPGMTGLWQVSGRSNLTWEESVRLDLRYVENWTLTWDIFIAFKTLSVMIRRHGAY